MWLVDELLNFFTNKFVELYLDNVIDQIGILKWIH